MEVNNKDTKTCAKTLNKLNFECLKTIDCKQGTVRAVRFNVDGSYCLTCGTDKKLKLWNPHRSLALKTYGGHGDEVLDACGSCDNSQLVSCGADKSVILWDVSTGQPLRRFRGHASRVTCVRYNEESTVAISGSHDNTVMAWDIRSRKNEPIQVLRDAKDSITSITVTDREIYSGSLDCKVRCYDIRAGEMVTDGAGEPVTSLSLTRDSQCLVISCSDSSVKLVDKDKGDLLAEYRGHETADFCIESCVDSCDRHILSGSVEGNIWCWDLVNEEVTDKLIHISGNVVHSLSSHPSNQFLLSASKNTIKLWGVPQCDD